MHFCTVLHIHLNTLFFLKVDDGHLSFHYVQHVGRVDRNQAMVLSTLHCTRNSSSYPNGQNPRPKSPINLPQLELSLRAKIVLAYMYMNTDTIEQVQCAERQTPDVDFANENQTRRHANRNHLEPYDRIGFGQ